MNRERFLGLFIDEARQHLQQATEQVNEFADRPQDPRTLRALMRHCHSLKSMAATMGYEPFVELAHRMEGLLQQLEGRPRMWSGELSPLFAAGLDRLSEWLERIGQGESPGADAATAELLARLDSQLTQEPASSAGAGSTVDLPAPEPTVWSVVLGLQIASASPTRRVVSTLRRVARIGRVLRVRPPQLPLDDSPAAIELQFDLASERTRLALLRRMEQLPGIAQVDIQEVEPNTKADTAPEKATAWTRVQVDTLNWLADTLRELAGEQLRAAEAVDPDNPAARRAAERARFLIKRLFDRVDELRLVPFVSVSHRLEPAVRDAARSTGAEVNFRIVGGEIGLDRPLLEQLVEPLRHLVRNAVAHGIEPAPERQRAGKPAAGALTLSVIRASEKIVIELTDDGRGMQPQALRDAAVDRGAIERDAAQRLDDRAALRLAFLPAVSTRTTADRLAGRGTGLEVVVRALEELDSELEVESTPGRGTRFSFSITLHQSIVQSLVFRRCDEIYALPLQSVRKTVQGSTSLTGLKLLDVSGRATADLSDKLLLLLDGTEEPLALVADELLGRRDLWIQPLALPAPGSCVTGAAMIESGGMALMIDPKRLPIIRL